MASTSVASAATSHSVVYHRSGSRPVAGNVSRQVIRWRGCKISQNDPLIECESTRTDYVD